MEGEVGEGVGEEVEEEEGSEPEPEPAAATRRVGRPPTRRRARDEARIVGRRCARSGTAEGTDAEREDIVTRARVTRIACASAGPRQPGDDPMPACRGRPKCGRRRRGPRTSQS